MTGHAVEKPTRDISKVTVDIPDSGFVAEDFKAQDHVLAYWVNPKTGRGDYFPAVLGAKYDKGFNLKFKDGAKGSRYAASQMKPSSAEEYKNM